MIIFEIPFVWPSRQALGYGWFTGSWSCCTSKGLGQLLTEFSCVQNSCQWSLVPTIYLKFKMAASLQLARREAAFVAFNAEFQRNRYVFWSEISGRIYCLNNWLSLSSQFRQSPRRTSPHFGELCPQAWRVLVRGKVSHIQASLVPSLGVFWLFNVLIPFSSEWSCVIATWSFLWSARSSARVTECPDTNTFITHWSVNILSIIFIFKISSK